MTRRRKPTHPVDPEFASVLRAVARSELTSASAIGQALGRSVPAALSTLNTQGYIQQQLSRRLDGTPGMLYRITAKGEAALAELGDGTSPVSTARVMARPNRAAYDGAEMRPFNARAGAMDAFQRPSRVGDHLHYRDGAVESLDADNPGLGKSEIQRPR